MISWSTIPRVVAFGVMIVLGGLVLPMVTGQTAAAAAGTLQPVENQKIENWFPATIIGLTNIPFRVTGGPKTDFESRVHLGHEYMGGADQPGLKLTVLIDNLSKADADTLRVARSYWQQMQDNAKPQGCQSFTIASFPFAVNEAMSPRGRWADGLVAGQFSIKVFYGRKNVNDEEQPTIAEMVKVLEVIDFKGLAALVGWNQKAADDTAAAEQKRVARLKSIFPPMLGGAKLEPELQVHHAADELVVTGRYGRVGHVTVHDLGADAERQKRLMESWKIFEQRAKNEPWICLPSSRDGGATDYFDQWRVIQEQGFPVAVARQNMGPSPIACCVNGRYLVTLHGDQRLMLAGLPDIKIKALAADSKP